MFICETCNKKQNGSRKYCSKECRDIGIVRNLLAKHSKLLTELAEDTDPRSLIRDTAPRRYYVYMWFKQDEIFPFYVGKGTEKRYIEPHYIWETGGTRRPAQCEMVGNTCKKFKSKILADSLTEQEAFAIERAFIDYFSSIGLVLANQY